MRDSVCCNPGQHEHGMKLCATCGYEHIFCPNVSRGANTGRVVTVPGTAEEWFAESQRWYAAQRNPLKERWHSILSTLLLSSRYIPVSERRALFDEVRDIQERLNAA